MGFDHFIKYFKIFNDNTQPGDGGVEPALLARVQKNTSLQSRLPRAFKVPTSFDQVTPGLGNLYYGNSQK